MQDPKRKSECEALLGELPGNDFDRLLDLGKRISDYTYELVFISWFCIPWS